MLAFLLHYLSGFESSKAPAPVIDHKRPSLRHTVQELWKRIASLFRAIHWIKPAEVELSIDPDAKEEPGAVQGQLSSTETKVA
jgi:hypothetical protein